MKIYLKKYEISFKNVIAIDKHTQKNNYEILTTTSSYIFSPTFGNNPYKDLSKIFQNHEAKNRSIYLAIQNQDVDHLKGNALL